MPNNIEYHKSIANEFKALEKRVRYLIVGAHPGEDGRYKEAIVMGYLRRILPQNLSVATGFVRNNDELTTQIDIIIYDNTYPVMFSSGDFIITTPESVIGIIEVKSSISSDAFPRIVEKASRNGKIITDRANRKIFNGIFSFNGENKIKTYSENLRRNIDNILLENGYRCNEYSSAFFLVNHIVLGQEKFSKLWGKDFSDGNSRSRYSFYDLEDGLAISYFFSNLLDMIYRERNKNIKEIPDDLATFFYPIRGGKETRKIHDADIFLEESE
jgi:hypothetical protein